MAQPTAAPRTTVLRDYWGPDGEARITLLSDWSGDVDSGGVAYRMGNRLIKANNDLVSALTGIPGQLRENWRILRDPTQRKLLARALVDEGLLTARRRKAIFSMLLWLTLLTYVVIGLVLLGTNPGGIGTYQSVYGLFFYSLATSVFLPTPFEILLENAVKNLGVFWTVTVAAFAKTAGAWVVLMMGDKANQGLAALLERRPLLKRMFNGMERFAQKYGYFAVFVLFAIPFMSDTAPLFILAVLKMKKAPFLATTFAAIVVRSLLYIYAGEAFAGLFG